MAEKQLMILYLYKLLLSTDKEHSMNAIEICEFMKGKYGYSCERRAIYEEIRRLKQFGMKIECGTGRHKGFYLARHDFELPELKLLVDAVQSSKFITKKKSDELIRKLEKLTNEANAEELQRQVFILNRIKTDNSDIYENVDKIHLAMRDNRQIRYKYCEWNIRKELVYRRDGADYNVSPWALTWDDENYYLVAFDTEAQMIKHYRVDKMQEVRVTDERRLGKESFTNFDLAAYARKTFGMFGGDEKRITLEGEKRFVGVIFDRFGTDIMIHESDKDHFHAHVTVSVSPQFFGWLTGLGKGVRITWPRDVKEEYEEYLRGILGI